MQSEERVCAKKVCRHLKAHCVSRMLPRIPLFYFLQLSVMSTIVLGAVDVKQKMKYYENIGGHKAL